MKRKKENGSTTAATAVVATPRSRPAREAKSVGAEELESIKVVRAVKEQPPNATRCHFVVEVDGDEEAEGILADVNEWDEHDGNVALVKHARSLCPSTAGKKTNQIRFEFVGGVRQAREMAERMCDDLGLGDYVVIEAGVPFSESVECRDRCDSLARLIGHRCLDVKFDPSDMRLDCLRRVVADGLRRRIAARKKEIDILTEEVHDMEGEAEDIDKDIDKA